ncbi:hypothetical protein ACIRPK_06265 [Kitasatospora sp. NPDC101801]|uniref:hypothetical protein n=1 Tax=Kitasatospora sp. NPDC101801 TaxID=3364103 RepID=UPI003815406C
MTQMLSRTAVVSQGFIVSIEDVTERANFTHLSDALAALWDALRALPLGVVQADAYRSYLIGEGSTERVREQLAQSGALALTFTMGGQSHLVEIIHEPSKRFPWTTRSTS